jgi:hypothetical protein
LLIDSGTSHATQWLSQEGLISNLIGRLNPTLDTEVCFLHVLVNFPAAGVVTHRTPPNFQIHSAAAQTLLDIIAVSYQTMAPAEQFLQGGDVIGAIQQNTGGNLLVDELKK